jgi:hypothetical protein
MARSVAHLTNPVLFVAAQDKEHESHAWAKAILKAICALPDPKQAVTGLSLSVAILGEELVNDALLSCGCFSLEELRFMAE